MTAKLFLQQRRKLTGTGRSYLFTQLEADCNFDSHFFFLIPPHPPSLLIFVRPAQSSSRHDSYITHGRQGYDPGAVSSDEQLSRA